MGFKWTQRNLTPIGIDFGADSVKLLQVIDEDPPRLVAAASVDIPAECRRNADAYRGFVGRSLKPLLREGKFKGRRAVASISSSQSYVQHVRLPKGDPTPIEDQLDMELRGRLPLDPSQMVIRHVEVGEVAGDGGAKQEVVCLAASRQGVMRQVRTAKAAGLNVVGMQCEPLAILAAFKHLFRRAGDVDRTTFFLDIGASTTKAMIAHGRDLVFAKTIHVGGDHFTRQLANQRGISVGEARLARIREATASGQAERPRPRAGAAPLAAGEGGRRGAAAPPGMANLETGDASAAMGSGKVDAEAAVQPSVAVRPRAAEEQGDSDMLDALVDELQLCIGYHGSMFPQRPIEKVVFLGGESRHVSMCQRIAQALQLPAQLGDPLARLVRPPKTPPPIGVDLRNGQPGWAVPLGVCLLPTNL